MVRPLALALVVAFPAVARAGFVELPPSGTPVANIELDEVTGSACTAAVTALDPDHPPSSVPHCTRLEALRVVGLGTVELDRVASIPADAGFLLVLSVRTASETRAVPLEFNTMCKTTSCRTDVLRSARLVRLAAGPHGDPAFGLEVEITVNETPSFKDLGPPSTERDHYRLACAARAGVLDCKDIELGDACRVLGWAGTQVRYACVEDAQLVPPRLVEAHGVPEADLETAWQLFVDIDQAVWQHRDDCPGIVKQLGDVLVRDADGATIARSLAAPPGALPPLFAKELQRAMESLAGAQTCLQDPAVRDALQQLARTVGAVRSP